ncbi:hypothetical protein CDL12_27558 [Handroanthus impetiginosus]|uniref:VQ domain-containing protein n=1 Tax=Handroanthus impetiginosus TaxID=429701 RepID=A0A2G9G3S1_9LAMI|nr:hypothetical protein CDL12_27558 [Handroanthus impetiginosus]
MASSSASPTTQLPSEHPQEIISGKPPPAFRSAFHSVRKPPGKNIITKKPIAPLIPTPPRIYKVDPVDFRDVVQKLTSAAPEFHPTRLQEVAPPPLNLSPPQQRATAFPDNNITLVGAISPVGFNLSPASLAWCSSVLPSPGTVASL